MRGLKTIIFLIISNTFITFAWYGHLKFKDYDWGKNLGLISVILISWGLAFFEYVFQVPANRAGFKGNGGPLQPGTAKNHTGSYNAYHLHALFYHLL
ncbi:uncharacterized protein (DUF486 family) [Mucilaginibacter sp. UYCu711]